ncbi:MAG: molecular chaperone HtpG, partial [Pseudomonadota bacterium]
VHSVYSEKEVFLRELISNASDACDKLRYESISDPSLLGEDPDLKIYILPDKESKTLSIVDTGIGMAKAELVENLGTIAKSGTKAFLDQMAEAKEAKDAAPSLIGQFGVGFYSAFMVAHTVTVTSGRAGSDEMWAWESDGTGEFSVSRVATAPAPLKARGTVITLHLRDGEEEFADAERLKALVRSYSNHIDFPIELRTKPDEEGERANDASALWVRPKSEITQEEYTEFYHHTAGAYDEPALTVHYRAEGLNSFIGLLYIPSARPFDLFDPERSGRIKLFVRRVFITDTAPLLPGYLRFVRGVVDSEDMPLNMSREMLQNNPVVAALKKALTGRVLSELEKLKNKERETFATVWSTFGAVLKEGLYEDASRRDAILKLALFKTTKGEVERTLEEVLADFKDNQTAFYYLTAEDEASARRSAQLEGYRARGLEVLLLTDPVDNFWLTAVEGFEGKPFKSVTRGTDDLSGFAKEEGAVDDVPAEEPSLASLIAFMKQTLEEEVEDVKRSDRLTDSAACLVAPDTGMDLQLEKFLAQTNQLGAGLGKRVLEVNPTHPLIAAMAQHLTDKGGSPTLEEAVRLVHDQTVIQEGETPTDVAAFAKRLSDVLARLFA